MSAFTPGPWLAAAKPSSVVGWPVVAPKDMGRSICNITVGHEYSEANARLIAAAPEMFNALTHCLGILCEAGDLNNYRNLSNEELGKAWQETAKEAAAALAKAKGEA